MTQTWTAVDQYIVDHIVPSDAALDEALRASTAGGLPAINVSPAQGKMLMLFAKLAQARAILEIGTLGGYSTIWLARALAPGGRLVTLEYEPKHAEVARANLARAGLSDVVDVRVGAALDTLPKIAAEGLGPFDVFFIDADKPNNPRYFEWALKLARPGSLIIVDNVIRDGQIVDPKNADPRVQGTRALYEMLAKEPRVSATAIQTVGNKGYDGFVMAIVTG
jgi:predicted O-methyltransferase YrrM